MAQINVYIDESGTIDKSTAKEQNYFIITMVFVSSGENKVKSIFKKERFRIIKPKPKLLAELIDNKEIKGSMLSEYNKKSIYKKLSEKCSGMFELGVIVLNNNEATENFKSVSSRAFNFLIKDYIINYFLKYSIFKDDCDSLNFIIDERNVATKAKFTLEDYLNTEIITVLGLLEKEIKIKYNDSKGYIMLQMADFISNTVYRQVQKNNPEAKLNIELLSPHLCNNKFYTFPLHYHED